MLKEWRTKATTELNKFGMSTKLALKCLQSNQNNWLNINSTCIEIQTENIQKTHLNKLFLFCFQIGLPMNLSNEIIKVS